MKEFLYSRNAVYEALRAGRRQAFTLLLAEGLQPSDKLTQIVKLAQERKCKIEKAPRTRLDKIHQNHQGVALEVSGYPYADLTDIFEQAGQRAEPLFVLLLDTLNDPQNFGTLLRTAEAVGVHGVVIPLARTVEVTPAVVNASSGASEHLRVAQANLHQAILELKKAGAWVVGLEGGAGATDASQVRLEGALGLVVGSEGEGMRPLTRKSCDVLMKLPMRGHIASLNAAVAGSVALYLAYLARKK
ncbi:MAG: 23S rRNA (guanosine(2251)-2'-O)-methyltransferase RlmB [Anaerolineales bacterium]|nr:23S rRNA (guanosine(2251)-2'-O)-methyltransferase RlmB [Anaerolineales bacterium]MCX7756216.1 23S rRNA (guanosine(2251)-2'-O)-methyltransferase RlmB [Anaerolineales bacterium]MDW8277424.1 23S rRNA (guanosine(2251)-2'-O)-methyltransferase RlmB [Anaerolineales bacterium]